MLTPNELDIVFSRWMTDEEPKELADEVAAALGAAFGDYLVDEHGFRWVVVQDEYGREYAVSDAAARVTAFPRSSVSKRIEDGETECFQNLRIGILDLQQRMQQEWAGLK